MSNIFKNFLSSMHLTEEDDDEYDEFVDEQAEKLDKKPRRMDKKQAKQERYDDVAKSQVFATQQSAAASELRKEKVSKVERSSVNKVVPIRTTPKGLEVCIMKPTSFEDSQEICDTLLTGRATVINLEGFDDKLAQRTMDFISGSVYAINGKLHRISNCIFIVSPDTVDISGDYLDLIQQNGFEPPTFHTKF